MNLKVLIVAIRLLLKDRKALWTFLGPIVVDLAKEVTDEVLIAASQIAQEIASVDGLTAFEARTIATQRLEALRAEEIGNSISDEAFDFLLALIIKRVKPTAVGVPGAFNSNPAS